jgi:hypothetical protein
MADPHPSKPAHPGDPIDLSESVAGEEDPGASIDLATVPETDVCPRCGGTGRLGASDCPDCGGTGRVIAGSGRG